MRIRGGTLTAHAHRWIEAKGRVHLVADPGALVGRHGVLGGGCVELEALEVVTQSSGALDAEQGSDVALDSGTSSPTRSNTSLPLAVGATQGAAVGRVVRPVDERLGPRGGGARHVDAVAVDPSPGMFAGMSAASTTSWDLAGRLLMSVEGVDEAQRDAIGAELDPFLPVERTGDADVIVGHLPSPELLEMQGPANDQRMTAVDLDGRLLARFGSRWVEVPPPHAAPVRVAVQTGLDIGLCWREVIRPAMHQALRDRHAVAVHGAAVDGGPTGGTIVSGWSESGKTEVALALVEAGASFLSDKWTVAGPDGEISAFPVGVGVRGWVLTTLPRLQASLPRRARAQLAAARLIRTGTGPLLDRAGSGRVTRLATGMVVRAVELGDRAGLSPTEIRQAYGQADDPARRVAAGHCGAASHGPHRQGRREGGHIRMGGAAVGADGSLRTTHVVRPAGARGVRGPARPCRRS